MGRSKSVFGPN